MVQSRPSGAAFGALGDPNRRENLRFLAARDNPLREVAAQYGPEATCIYTGRGNFEFGLNEAFAPAGTAESSANAVLFPFGSPNTTGVGSLCYVSYGMIAPRALFRDYIRTISANVFVNFLDRWAGYSTASLTVTHGLDILGATTTSDPDKSRVGAGSDYWRLNFEASRSQPLFGRLSLYVAAAGQTSFNKPLLASEQFALGGTNFDRGFDPSEVTGDAAIAGRGELRVDAYTEPGFVSDIQPYGFYEGGEVWQAKALPGTPKHDTLTSAGFGVRFSIGDRFHADVSWDKPFHRDVAALGNRDARVFFTVSTNL